MTIKSKSLAALGVVALFGIAPAAQATATTTDPAMDTAMPADEGDGDEGRWGLLGLLGLAGLLGMKRRDRDNDGINRSGTTGR